MTKCLCCEKQGIHTIGNNQNNEFVVFCKYHYNMEIRYDDEYQVWKKE